MRKQWKSSKTVLTRLNWVAATLRPVHMGFERRYFGMATSSQSFFIIFTLIELIGASLKVGWVVGWMANGLMHTNKKKRLLLSSKEGLYTLNFKKRSFSWQIECEKTAKKLIYLQL